ncbi:hypothetical protein KUTeg_001906 [Tegillarca granosa]|uniref:C-type lectin domain-containing protein n=1 Tax=Tegillarca granosa TaxID=220873 RepID=A0ABQ9FSS6_TEGGR|nr:hypothetical protein KUTeg_001906 [Tegillarca granosa]
MTTYSCPSQFTYPGHRTMIGEKCYEFILFHPADWVHAREDCHKKGGYLVTINNIQEEKLFTHYIQSTQYGGKGVWIGLNDLQREVSHQATSPSSTVKTMNGCPSQTTYTGNQTTSGTKCYEYILFHPADWEHARNDCSKKGGNLVTIESKQEENLLTHYIQSTQYGGKGVWIGLNDLQYKDHFVWDSGRKGI